MTPKGYSWFMSMNREKSRLGRPHRICLSCIGRRHPEAPPIIKDGAEPLPTMIFGIFTVHEHHLCL
jgi:hypothetical protein